jgi:glycosyltransferase involved in cell wall biosynthesis/ubiquinone/menaquinone biosynthesis C-methylase UbiE
MKFIDERLMNDSNSGHISYEHWHRYFYATQFVKGKNVLDIACDKGYGSNLLAQTAQSVIGIDFSTEPIAFAREHFRLSNLSFLQGSMEQFIGADNKKIDVVVCFDIIENMNAEAHDIFLKETKRILKDDGIFIVSPSKKLFCSDISNYNNELHLRKSYEQSFYDFLRKYFEHVKLFGLKVFTGSVLWNPDDFRDPKQITEYYISNNGHKIVANDKIKDSFYLLAICSDSAVKATKSFFLLDNSLSILSKRDIRIPYLNQIVVDHENQINNQIQAVFEPDEKIQKLSQSLSEREIQVAKLNQEVTGRYERIEELVKIVSDHEKKMIELKKQVGDMQAAIIERDSEISKISKILTERDDQITNLNNEVAERDNQILVLVEERDQIFKSSSWRITIPLRFIRINIVNKALFLIRYFVSNIVRGVWKIFPLTTQYRHLIKQFLFNNLSFIFKWSSAYQYWAAINESNNMIKHNVPDEQNRFSSDIYEAGKQVNIIKFRGSSSILFVGHDALLAGGQVLLLSLIKWIRNNTGIVVKVILLNGGTLIDQYKDIAPTLIWNDLFHQYPDKEKRKEILHELIGQTDLIYGNTVLAATIYDDLKFLKVPYITHVHELEKSIKMYFDKSIIDKMHFYTDGYIAGSKPVEMNLIRNHHGAEKKIILINDFIESRTIDFDIPKKDLRKKIGLIDSGLIIVGCGTMYWRKGVDLFIDTAIILKNKGISNFHFYWIGENIWDLDHASQQLCSWNSLLQKIKDCGVSNHISFQGVKENFFEYIHAADVFYLPSREDPFPLVCLEAAQFQIPVICFKDAGGMVDFIENDAGFVVPYEDINAAAEKIIYIEKYPDVSKRLGVKGRKKYLLNYSIDTAAPKTLNFCRQIGNVKPAVSVIVPNYNCEKYLKKRLDSIVNQTFKDFEIILLDDCSTDRSLEILNQYLDYPNVRFIKNQCNGGNPFKQWYKGFLEAKGEILWFAESDDYCEHDLLEKILPGFNNPSVVLAYGDSFMVDESNKIIGDYTSYLDIFDSRHWKSSYQVSGTEEINFGLGIKNTIPNASAVLIRKNCIVEDIFKKTFQFKFSGDWFFYTQVIKGKDISFCCEKLNYHRKHMQTVTSKFNQDKTAMKVLLKEAELIHSHIIEDYSINEEYLKKWQYYMAEQIHAFYPNTSKKNFNRYYQYTTTEDKIKKKIIEKNKNKRLVFLTTNDGAPNGGSEQLWIETAIKCQKLGHQVMIIIKKWDPEPSFIQLFYDLGIKIIFKGNNEFNEMFSFNPDLLIISTGDQDEGIEWYDKCKKSNISYIIINQLTKEPEYWPIRKDINEKVKSGYLGAAKVFFTCENNHKVMEKRLNCQILNAIKHYNPFHIEKNSFVPFPPMDNGLKIAIPANLVQIHKGQHMAIELFNWDKWRERPIQLNLYGRGTDEKVLKAMVKEYALKQVVFHQPTPDLLTIWRDNHAIFMPSFMEGLPVVLVSAMICARVPILTDIGGHREVVDDNINGFIAKKPAVDALDEALERAYQKSDMWEEMGKKAREKILSFLPPNDPVEDFISKIIPLTNK